MSNHPTKRVLYRPGKYYAKIDELLAPLIKEMWKAGIETNESCQHVNYRDGKAWISLDDVADFQKLTRIVLTPDEKDKLTQHASIYSGAETYFDEEWLAQVHAEVYQPEEDPDDWEFVYSVDWYFPQEDIPELVKRLRAYNDGA